MKIRAILVAASVVIGMSIGLYADETWNTRSPTHDAYVQYSANTSNNYGLNTSMLVGRGRETCMKFDVSDLANITAARLKLYVASNANLPSPFPVIVRTMFDDTWDEQTVTWNSLSGEFGGGPSALIANDDPTFVACVDDMNGIVDTWMQVDVTEAVKVAARKSGRLALHIYTTDGNANGGYVSLASKEREDESLRPCLEFQGEVSEYAGSEVVHSKTLSPSADAWMYSSEPNANKGSSEWKKVLVNKNGREGLMKFDLYGIPAGTLATSAKLRVRMNDTQSASGNTVQFRLTDASWDETTVTWNNPPSGVTPGAPWVTEKPADAIRVGSADANQYYEIEVAGLLNKVLESGGTEMSLHITVKDAPGGDASYFIFYSKESDTAAYRPQLTVSYVGNGKAVGRGAEWNTHVNSSQGGVNYSADARTTVQTRADGTVIYGLQMFDPADLEDAEFVRLRVKANEGASSSTNIVRFTSYVTDAWDGTLLTWNTLTPYFPNDKAIIDGDSITESLLDGELGAVECAAGRSQFMEIDVTAPVREAARQGRMISFGMFGGKMGAVTSIEKSGTYSAPSLIFPNPTNRFCRHVRCSLDMSGCSPALKLRWTPHPRAGATYRVERLTKETWKHIADGLTEPECLDMRGKPGQELTYRITATLADRTILCSTNQVTLVPSVTVFAEADTFVRSGQYAEEQHGQDASVTLTTSDNSTSDYHREGFLRFDIAQMPQDFRSATLKIYPTMAASGTASGAKLQLLKYPDLEWSDGSAPTWSEVFGNDYSTVNARNAGNDPMRATATLIDEIQVESASGSIAAGVPVSFDVGAAVRAARQAGESHVTLLIAPYRTSTIGLMSKERAFGVSCASQMTFTLRDWTRGIMINFR